MTNGVIRIGYTSACTCVNVGRALYRMSRTEVRVFVEVHQYFRINVVEKHIRTENNTVEEILSPGRGMEAEKHARREGPVS